MLLASWDGSEERQRASFAEAEAPLDDFNVQNRTAASSAPTHVLINCIARKFRKYARIGDENSSNCHPRHCPGSRAARRLRKF